jgi:hypothetical protein
VFHSWAIKQLQTDVDVPFYANLSDLLKSTALWQVSRLRPFVLPVRATRADEHGTFVE